MKPTNSKNQDRELSSEKTEAILKGAMQEFLEHGYTATTMDKVAAAAGVSKATVYSHFQDKEALFKAIIQHKAWEKGRAIYNPGDKQSLQGDAGVVLRRFATNMLNSTTQDPEFFAFVRLMIGESGRFPELARAFVNSFDQAGHVFLRSYLASCAELHFPDPEIAAYNFIGSLVHFLISQEIMHGKDVVPIDRDRFVDSLIDLMTNRRPAP